MVTFFSDKFYSLFPFLKYFKHSVTRPSVHGLEYSCLSYYTDSSIIIKSIKAETLQMILGTAPDNPKTKFGPLAHFGMLLKTQHRFIQQGLLMIVDSYCRIFDKTVS